MIEFILDVWKSNPDRDAVVWRDRVYDYGTLVELFEDWKQRLPELGVKHGSVVVLDADFSPNAVAWVAIVTKDLIARLTLLPVPASKSGNCRIRSSRTKKKFVL